MTFEQIMAAQQYLKLAKQRMAARADNSAAEFSALSTAEAVVTINLNLMIALHNLRDKSDRLAVMACFSDFMAATNNTH